jgi:aerobic C4-dicarboxylate transport protein
MLANVSRRLIRIREVAMATKEIQCLLPTKRRFYQYLYFQVLCAIVAGVLLGYFYPEASISLKPFADAFVKLTKMMTAPLVFFTVVHGIASMESLKQIGRVGLKSISYFEIMTIIAMLLGLLIVNLWHPGTGMNVNPSTLDTKSITNYTTRTFNQSAIDYLLHIIPTTIVGAFAEGEILQVLFFAVLFAFALQSLGERGKPALHVIGSISHALFETTGIIMKVAPLGSFCAMAFTIGKYGIHSLASIGALIASFYATCLLFIFGVLGIVCRVCGFSLLRFLRYIKEEILIVLGTSSSEAALPRMIAKMENLGCGKSVAGLVIPAGYSFNMDGTCIYLTMAAIFLAQATNTPLTLAQQLGILAILLLTSKGAAGVAGSGFVVLASTLSVAGHIPVASIALILGADRFLSEARAVTNLIGNGVAAVVVAKWEGTLDERRMHQHLGSDSAEEADDPEQVLIAAKSQDKPLFDEMTLTTPISSLASTGNGSHKRCLGACGGLLNLAP